MTSWFISDLHLRDTFERNGQTLLRFLFYLNQNPKEHSLYLLGDIFDFWLSNGRAFENEYKELVEQIEKGMTRQAVISLLGQPDGTTAIGQGQGMLYYLSDEEAFFISIDKNGNVFSADRQERSK